MKKRIIDIYHAYTREEVQAMIKEGFEAIRPYSVGMKTPEYEERRIMTYMVKYEQLQVPLIKTRRKGVEIMP